MSNQQKLREAIDKFEQVVTYGQQMREQPLEEIDDGDEEMDVVYTTEATYEYAYDVGAISATDEELATHGISLTTNKEE